MTGPSLASLCQRSRSASPTFQVGVGLRAYFGFAIRANYRSNKTQSTIDERKENGLYILTGSQAIPHSLKGRMGQLHLLPLSLGELREAGFFPSLDEAIVRGAFPLIFYERQEPKKTYRNYFQTYVERDVRQLVNVKDLVQFQRFVKLCAGRVGQLINLEAIGGEVGIASATVKEWISILEASFVVFRLQPYFENFGKRVTKAAKLYFTDVGLLSYLLGIETVEQAARDPLRGQLVENVIILELMKARLNQGLDPNLYFFRDAHGHEVDVVFEVGRKLVAIEIKGSKTYNQSFLKGLAYFQKMAGDMCIGQALIYGGEIEQRVGEVELLPYTHAARALLR